MDLPINSRPSPPDSDSRSVRRRRRLALACTECRRRKVACDRGDPCKNCVLRKSSCIYRGMTPTRAASARNPEHRRGTDVVPTGGPLESETFTTAETAGHEPGTFASHTFGHKTPIDNDGGSSRTSGDALLKPGSRFTKSRLFGRSHWMNKIYQFTEINRVNLCPLIDDGSEVYRWQDKCKRLARALKGPHSLAPTGRGVIDADLKSLIPSREICDTLLALYFRTFNSIFRVLHRPSFQKEVVAFWANAGAPNEVFATKFVLVLAIGTTFYTGSDVNSVRAALSAVASDVVLASQTWECVPLSKHALTEDTIQMFLLTLIARQTSTVSAGGDNSWISAGALLRTAMMMGLHRDPRHLCHISTFWEEMRRRLWYGILEMLAQTSADYGLLPMITHEEWDTEIPANIDDEELKENMMSRPESKPSNEVWTDSSAQCALARSLPLRLQIVRLLNGLRAEPSYEETLQIGKELADQCRDNGRLLELCRRSCAGPDELSHAVFQLKLVDTLNRRFLLSLHTPFARESRDNQKYYFARHACTDSALKILAYGPPTQKPSSVGPDSSTQADHIPEILSSQDDHILLHLRCRATFRAIFLESVMTISVELSQQVLEDPSPPVFGLPPGPESLPVAWREMHKAIKDGAELQRGRVWMGETNVRSFVSTSTAMITIDWLIRNTGRTNAFDNSSQQSFHDEVAQRQKEMLEESWKVLKKLKAEKDERNGIRKADIDVARLGDGRDQVIDVRGPGGDTGGLWDESPPDNEYGVADPLDSFLSQRSNMLSGDPLGPWFYTDLDGESYQF
ncbi:hypothetical protein GGR54DRAFT_62378 [Hypoxylon sp. NC1633]|nr:hypothetical protein GGR54DRAFT_62378 [Hypoxylon sp. NC1633]